MKGSHRQPPAAASNPAPLSPNSKATAKYTNKDGSKFITVPKGSTPVDSSHPSPTSASATAVKNAAPASPGPLSNGPLPPVNRKKQKRRAKAAAKAAAEQALTGAPPNGLPSPPASHEQHSGDADADDSHDEDEDHYADGSPQQLYPHQNGYAQGEPPSMGKKAKKKKKKTATSSANERRHQLMNQQFASGSGSPHSGGHRRPGISREKIWNTSSQEERERIKQFWLGLTESERKSLVKVEKDAVLKKMKEQQKHTCSCTVCGRKRTAIEEELEGLYDAYYEELEQYANHPSQGDGPPLLRPNRPYGHTSSGRSHGHPSSYSNHLPSRGRIEEHVENDEEEHVEEGDDLSEDDDLGDGEYSSEGLPLDDDDYRPNESTGDFFNFGNSLTVQGRDRLPILPSFLQSYPFSGAVNNAYGSSSLGGILTVADDLLKNDGKKFIEMMEQLAERRMAREEDAREQFERSYDHANGNRYGHSHPPPDEDEYDDEEEEDDEEEYDDEDEEEYDSQEEEDTMTEEQRMEEGRRMFQIFAARMFEQRVLTAYREKVAKERQAKLIEEIEAENQQESQRKAKKAKEAQKRKDKAAKKKEALAEEKARREAEKAAEEAARLAEEARKAEEQRLKAEEKCRKREAQKKAEEEERQRKEAERQRRIHEREEADRKAREARERERKAREEARQKDKEAKEQREREARERREQQERDKRDKDAKAKANREAREAREVKESKEKEKLKQQERAAQKAAALAAAVPVPITLPKRPAQLQGPAATVPALPQQPTSFSSPQIPVATPAFPKAPTPMRARQPSQQESTATSSHSGSGPSQNPSPHPLTPVYASPGPIGPPSKSGQLGSASAHSGPHPPSHPASPLSGLAQALLPQSGPFGMPPQGMGFPSGIPPQIPPPGFNGPMHRDMYPSPMHSQMLRPAPGLGPAPPGYGSPVGGRGFPVNPPPGFTGNMDSTLGGIGPGFGPMMPREPGQSHSRQGSGSFEPGTPVTQPIGRPAPIGRPSSVVQGQRPPSGSPGGGVSGPEPDVHLGSSALLDEFDEPLQDFAGRPPRGPFSDAPGPRAMPAYPMGGMGVPFGMDPIFPPAHHNLWGPANVQPNMFAPPMPTGPPPGFPLSMPWGPPAPLNSTFGGPAVLDRPSEPRYVVIRKMLCRACQDLAGAATDGFISLDDIKAKLQLLSHGDPVDEKEVLEMCETEGNHQNGGGSFDLREDSSSGKKSIRWDPSNDRSNPRPIQRAVGAPGEIGSPVTRGYR